MGQTENFQDVEPEAFKDDAIRFARLVCCNTGIDDFPVLRLGSGVIVPEGEDFFLITARHVFTDTLGNPRSVVVPFKDSGTQWWATDACMHLDVTSPFEHDNGFGDLAIYSMYTPESIRKELCGDHFISFALQSAIGREEPLFAFGYPDEEAELDLESRTLNSTLLMIDGSYGGKSTQFGIDIFE